MINEDKWAQTKYIYRNHKLVASRNPAHVHPGSRLVVDLVASFYDQYLKHYAHGKLLDLGCGRVPLYQAYREFITDNTCVDWEESIHENEFTDIRTDLNKSLPIKNNEFDTIILSDVLEHVSQPELLWSEMARVLKPGGVLFLNVPFYYHIHEQPHDYYRYTHFALERFALVNQLEVILLKPLGGLPEVLTDIFSKILAHCPLAGRYLAAFVQYCTKQCLKLRITRRLSQRTALTFPIGYFMIARKR